MGLRGLCVCYFLCSGIVSFSQKLLEDKINVLSGSGVDNRDAIIYLPINYSADKAYPLVVFTHGMGQAGKDVKKLYEQGLPKVLKSGYQPPFDFIMVAVQRNSFSVMPEWLPGILHDCQTRWKIDASRIYLTGLSAGGWAVYGSQLNISPSFAKKFAAIVINSGATQNTHQKNLDWWKESKTPLWAIVGSADKGFLGRNTYMVTEINKRVPGLAALTIRPGIGHGGWTDVYNGTVKLNGKNMWEWLYQFKRSSPGTTKPPVEQVPLPDKDSAVVSPAAVTKYIKINIFSGTEAGTNHTWNNWNVGAFAGSRLTTSAFSYNNGAPTPITATLSSSSGTVDNGADYGGGMVAAAVLRYASYSLSNRTLTLQGLSPTKKYKLYLYASRRDRAGYTTVYKINQNTRIITTNNNHTDIAYFGNLHPDTDGRLQVMIETGNRYNYLNGFMIAESEASSAK